MRLIARALTLTALATGCLLSTGCLNVLLGLAVAPEATAQALGEGLAGQAVQGMTGVDVASLQNAASTVESIDAAMRNNPNALNQDALMSMRDSFVEQAQGGEGLPQDSILAQAPPIDEHDRRPPPGKKRRPYIQIRKKRHGQWEVVRTVYLDEQKVPISLEAPQTFGGRRENWRLTRPRQTMLETTARDKTPFIRPLPRSR